jgi:hypothetical protein
MEPAGLAVVVARNMLLLAMFAVALWRVWALPGGEVGARQPDSCAQPPRRSSGETAQPTPS